ncbi:MAG: Arc family DNA-binding protein [Rhizobiaceae bacterium]|nr:Arc family DNA-binding protein [Rhizobiaceae bacterium]
MATPKQTDPQFKLRLTGDLRDKIETAAKASNRSMNAEMIARLEESFSDNGKALLEATLVVESLRKNLTERIWNYDQMAKGLQKREAELNQLLNDKVDVIEMAISARREELEAEYQRIMQYAEEQRRSADEYAGFTVARERQFVEMIKLLTGKEPPPVQKVPRGEFPSEKKPRKTRR